MRMRREFEQKPNSPSLALVKNEKLHTCIHVIARLQYVHSHNCSSSNSVLAILFSSLARNECYGGREEVEETKKNEKNVVKMRKHVEYKHTQTNTNCVYGSEWNGNNGQNVLRKKNLCLAVYCCCCWLLFVDFSMGPCCIRRYVAIYAINFGEVRAS